MNLIVVHVTTSQFGKTRILKGDIEKLEQKQTFQKKSCFISFLFEL